MSSEPIIVDPSTWTGMSPPQWPSPTDHPFPAPLTAQRSRSIPLFAGFSLLFIGLVQIDQMYAPNRRGTLFGAMVALAWGLWLLWTQYRAKSRSQPVVSMTAQGLAIPRWFEKVVPWSEVENVVYTSFFAALGHRAPGIRITIRDEGRFKPTQYRSMLQSPLPTWLDVRQKKLHEAIQAHRAHFGRGGNRRRPL